MKRPGSPATPIGRLPGMVTHREALASDAGPRSDRPVHGAAGSCGPTLVSPIAPDLAIPAPGEVVPWSSGIRADVPHYITEQMREATHRYRITHTALLLHLMAAYRDAAGNPVFVVREEDLVADRRRARR